MRRDGDKPVVGIILGDPSGIGPEITLKLLLRSHTFKLCKPVLIGNYDLVNKMAENIIPDLFLTSCTVESFTGDSELLPSSCIPVVHVPGDETRIFLGRANEESGIIAYRSICSGCELLEAGAIDGLVMAPINKEAMAKSGCGFKSEYEVFEKLFNVDEVQTVVKGGSILRSSVIGHVPFREILNKLTVERIVQTGVNLDKILKSVFSRPVGIAIAALNPHCGEGGALGLEEKELILPAIQIMRDNGINISGPFPADTIFLHAMKSEFNGIIYLYHDQGNIAMKTKMFETTAVIYTNVPYCIMSTGHGSALDIAKLGIANPTNLAYVISTITETLRISKDKKDLTAAEETNVK